MVTSTESAICPCGLNTAYCFKHRPPATFVVTETAHPDCKFCLDCATQAMSLARVSGSAGGTFETEGAVGGDHRAVVARADKLTVGGFPEFIVLRQPEPVPEPPLPPDPNTCPSCGAVDRIREVQTQSCSQDVRINASGDLEYGQTDYYEAIDVDGFECGACMTAVELTDSGDGWQLDTEEYGDPEFAETD